jgi:SSS family solute:Na+ symporter
VPSSGLAPWDWAVVAAYLAAILAMAAAIAWRQRTGADYFLAGRAMRGAPLGASILANQASAVSLIGAPAFVALREGGGLRWLQYELALPLAMLLLIAFLLPALRSVPGFSIYAYAERRFGRGTRQAVAGAFVLSRGLALGVVLYASSLVIAAVTGWSTPVALLAIGLVSVAYTSVGGIVADIWSDVLQLGLLWLGTLAAALWLVRRPGLLEAIPAERTQALVLGTGLGGETFTLAPMLLGGLFLYLSYYGCDQSQAQRLLAARDDGAARRALVLNGLVRFPLVLTYCGFGLLLAGLLRIDPAFAARVTAGPPDGLVPAFVVSQLPVGLRGLLVAGILAAAMSSIDSALNSLAAVTLEDVLGRASAATSVWLGRATSLGWGGFAILAGLVCARSGAGVLEAINLVGSIFYGPLLGVFSLGLLAPGVRGYHAVAGMAAGVGANLALALAAPQVSWLWWNPAGWLVSVTLGLLLARARPRLPRPAASRREVLLLAGGFVLMLALLALL